MMPIPMSLHQFLTANRLEILARARRQVSDRPAPRATSEELEHGLPLFFDQLIGILRAPPTEHSAAMAAGGTDHGDALLKQGFTVGQVVQDYGGLCQAITGLATESRTAISSAEFQTLNGCLDYAVAAAVTEFGRRREQSISTQGVERLGFLAHELRNALNTATLAFSALQLGVVGINGSTSGVVVGSLARMRDLLDRSLAEVRLNAGLHRPTRLSVADLIEEVGIAAAVDATHRGLQLTVGPVAAEVTIRADAQLLASALSNLLQNAFKFTRPNGHVSLQVHATADHVRIDVADECGGLPAGTSEDLFRMFEQRGSDRTGLGLGLAISRKGVEDSGGAIQVRDVPGKGCVFTVDLPRSPYSGGAAKGFPPLSPGGGRQSTREVGSERGRHHLGDALVEPSVVVGELQTVWRIDVVTEGMPDELPLRLGEVRHRERQQLLLLPAHVRLGEHDELVDSEGEPIEDVAPAVAARAQCVAQRREHPDAARMLALELGDQLLPFGRVPR